MIDDSDNIWIGTASDGLIKYDQANWKQYDYRNSGLPNLNAGPIAIDKLGNIWIGTAEGLVKYDGTAWKTYNTSNSGLPYDCISSLAMDRSGNLWIGAGDQGLTKFDGQSWITYNTSNSGLPNNWVYSIAIDEKGDKWIGTRNGIAKFDGMIWTIFTASNSGLPENNVYTIAIDEIDNKWIATHSGLVVFNENGILNSINENAINARDVKVFPNPVNNYLNVELPVEINSFWIEVLNMQGNIVKSRIIANNHNKIDVSDLLAGVYIVRVQSDKGQFIKKIIKY
jgi:ligand-binding sensor domain-containing protein